MPKPKVIFLDAVGTLFGVKGGVGEFYSAIAREFGVDVSPETLESAFNSSFKAAPPLKFPQTKLTEIPQQEYEWWETVVKNTFTEAGVIEEFTDFNAFFNQLYGEFATAKPWVIYPDIIPTLQKWKDEKIDLGIISNFDSRLHAVLQVLGLSPFFKSVTISSCAGFAKPEPEIFALALGKHDCQAQDAWHVGDSIQKDYNGAKAAGIRPFLLKRS